MATTGTPSQRKPFWNYPVSKPAPDIECSNTAGSNPVLRGIPLAIAATIISFSSYIQSILWKLNKFDKLKDISGLTEYEPRYDPTVTPALLSNAPPAATSHSDLPARPRALQAGYYTAADYHAAYSFHSLAPIAVVESLLPLIRRDTSPPGSHSIAFLYSNVHSIVSAAEASTRRYASGESLSGLDGVPIAVKDEAEVTDYPRCNGSPITFTASSTETAWCVAKLESLGAIVIGKTTMHEMGLDTTGNNPTYGTPRNPHNPDYYTGGSSSGSAYAVAAGLVPIAVGSDGGGSIRVPASFCGVYGLKTTHGRISGRPSPSLGSVGVWGPIAGSVDDLAVTYRAMAQPDLLDCQSSSFPSPISETQLQLSSSAPQKRYIGICRPWLARADADVKSFFDATIVFYTNQLKYDVVDIALPFLPESQKAHALTILSEVRSGLSPAQISKLTYPNQLLLNVAGGHATAQDFIASQRLRELMMQHLASLWDKHPGMLIVTPTTPCHGWKIGRPGDVVRGGRAVSDGDMSLRSMEYVFLANWVGCPAISCPMDVRDLRGGNKGGPDVPAGVMAMAEWGREEQLLVWAKEGEGMWKEGGIPRPERDGGWIDVLDMTKKHGN